jgi:iron complex transport system ATP-binding protein
MSAATLTAEGVAVGYGGRAVAVGLDLALHAGELACLIGPNGAGKSTLMRSLVGMQPVLAGVVRVCGKPLHGMTAIERARHLGVVLTERPNLGLLSGAGLVALGRHPYTDWRGHLTAHDERVIRWAIDAVGAAELADQPVMELSDGQRQRLMIARVLAQETDVIVLDEPTAFLDLPRRVETLQLLRHLARETGCAVLLSTHELDLALRTADRIWLMHDGHIVSGAPEDLVLSGAFEQAFASEGVMFDPQTGAFRVAQPSGQRVTVSGEGLRMVWLQRMLARGGFTVGEGMGEPHVMVTAQGWRVTREGRSTDHADLSGVLAALRGDELH